MNDADEQALLALYRQTRDEPGPSELVDRRVRRAAKRQLDRRRKRWWWGLSTAAVLVLSFSVVLQMQLDVPDMSVNDQTFGEALKDDKGFSSTAKTLPAPRSPQQERKRAMARQQFLDNNRKGARSDQRIRSIESFNTFEIEQSVSVPEQMPAAPLPARTSAVPFVPHLPENLQDLLVLQPGIKLLPIEKSDGQDLYIENKRIVRKVVTPLGVQYSAWPGSEVLGVKVDWQLSQQEMQQCYQDAAFQVCKWADPVEAVFNGVVLDHVRWIQSK